MKRPLALLSLLALSLTLPACRGTRASDPVSLSFVTVGCDRVNRIDWVKADNPSSANVNQLRQTFADVAALASGTDHPPSYFFFTGDLVLGDTDDGGTNLNGQLHAWADLYDADPLARLIHLVPLPGNHEMLAYDPALGGRKCLPEAAHIWSGWLADRGFDVLGGNGPRGGTGDPDHLTNDESRITYSRTLQGTHLVVLDTDACTTDPETGAEGADIGQVALRWLGVDLDAAQADPGVREILILGHKPILPVEGDPTPTHGPDDRTVDPGLRGPMLDLLMSHDKVKAYLCSHAHLFEASRLVTPDGPWQIVVGTGGSQVEPFWLPSSDTWYGFLQVEVHESGTIAARAFARPVPTHYMDDPAQPAVETGSFLLVDGN